MAQRVLGAVADADWDNGWEISATGKRDDNLGGVWASYKLIWISPKNSGLPPEPYLPATPFKLRCANHFAAQRGGVRD
jgi:hypothetical protein